MLFRTLIKRSVSLVMAGVLLFAISLLLIPLFGILFGVIGKALK